MFSCMAAPAAVGDSCIPFAAQQRETLRPKAATDASFVLGLSSLGSFGGLV